MLTKDLNSFEHCNAIWNHIGMPLPMNRVRFDMLNDLKVEVFPDRLIAKVKANANVHFKLFEGA